MNRILKDWKTTVIGLAILMLCFVLVFMEKATLTEVGGFICGGFYVLFSKDSMLKKKNIPCIFIFALLVSGCRPYESFTDRSESVRIDTLIIRDSIPIRIEIPGDSVWMEADTIIYDTIYVKALQNGTFTIPPWDTCTRYAYARAGITNNKPWLNLEQRKINVDTMVYVNHIRILEERIRELNKQIVVKERDPFYKNVWLWVSLFLFFIGFILLKRNARN